MKRFIFIVLIFCTVFGHTQQRNHTWFPGVHLGCGWNSMSPDFTDSMGRRYFFPAKFIINGGLRARIPVNSRFAIVPVISLTDKNSRRFYEIGNTQYKQFASAVIFVQLSTNMIATLPLRHGNFYTGGGPYLAFNTRSWEDLGKKDFGINLMCSYEFPLGYFIEVNFTQGLIKQPLIHYFLPASYKPLTRFAGFSIGYMF